MAPKTVAEARALREIATTLSGDIFMGGGGVDGDSIIMFIDSDGQSKTVSCIRETIDGPDEWVKVPI